MLDIDMIYDYPLSRIKEKNYTVKTKYIEIY